MCRASRTEWMPRVVNENQRSVSKKHKPNNILWLTSV